VFLAEFRREIASGFVEKYNSAGTSASYETRASASSAREISRRLSRALGKRSRRSRWRRKKRPRVVYLSLVGEQDRRAGMFACDSPTRLSVVELEAGLRFAIVRLAELRFPR